MAAEQEKAGAGMEGAVVAEVREAAEAGAMAGATAGAAAAKVEMGPAATAWPAAAATAEAAAEGNSWTAEATDTAGATAATEAGEVEVAAAASAVATAALVVRNTPHCERGEEEGGAGGSLPWPWGGRSARGGCWGIDGKRFIGP